MPQLRTNNLRQDPFRKFQFTLHTEQIVGVVPAPVGAFGFQIPAAQPIGFTEISGLRSETELIEYKEGDITFNRKIPGKTTFDNIVCSRGMDPGNTLLNWRTAVIEDSGLGPHGGRNDEGIRQNLVISLYDRRGKDQGLLLKQWKCYECYPLVYEVEELSGNSSDVLIERVEFAVEWWELSEFGLSNAVYNAAG